MNDMISRTLFSRSLKRISPSTTPRSDVDIPLLDTKTVEDYVVILKSLRNNDANAPWDVCHTLAEHLKWSRVLLSLLSVVSSESDSSLKIARCIDAAFTLLKADSVQLFEIDDKGHGVKLIMAKLNESVQHIPSVKGFKYSKGNTIEDETLRKNEIVNIKDAQSDSRYNPELDTHLGISSRGVLCAPVADKCGVLKVVRCSLKDLPADMKPPFSNNDEIIIEFLAKMVSIIIRRSIQETTIANQGVKISSLDNLFSYGASDFELNDIIQRIIDDAHTTLKAEKVSLFIHEQGHLGCHFSDDIKGLSIPCNIGIAGKSFTEKVVLNIPDVQVEKCFYSGLDREVGYFTRSVLSAPIIHEDGTCYGVMQALNKRGGAKSFSDADVQQIKVVCQRVAFLLSKKEFKQSSQQLHLSRQGLVSASIDLHRCLTESQVAVTVKQLFSSLTDISHVALLKCVNGRLEVLPATTVTTAADDPRLSSPPLSSFVNISTLPDTLIDSIAKGVIGEAIVDTGAAEMRELSAFLPTVASKPMSCHLIMLPLSEEVHSKYLVTLVREGKQEPYSVAEKKDLALLSQVVVAALSNAREKSVLQTSMERSRTCMHLMNGIMSSMKVFVILLGQDGALLGSNRPLEGLFGELYANAYSIPSLDAADIGRSYSQENKKGNFLRWIDGIHKSLGEDIREVMETFTCKRVDEVLLSTPVYPDGVVVNYEVTCMSDNDGANLAPDDGSINDIFDYTSENWIYKFASSSRDSREELKESSASGCGARATCSTSGDQTVMVTVHIVHTSNKNQEVVETSVDNVHTQAMLAPRDIALRKSSKEAKFNGEPKQQVDARIAAEFFGQVVDSLQSIRTETILEQSCRRESQSLMSTVLQFTSDIKAIDIPLLKKETFNASDPSVYNGTGEVFPRREDPDVQELLLWDWDFDVLSVGDRNSLIPIIIRMFLHLFNFSEVEVNFAKFDKFLRRVQQTYHDNPFHNFFHAACVTHMLAMFINETNARESMAPHLLFALLLSAVTHDVGHPGKTNGFLINSGSDLALLYNDEAVLESFHSAKTFSILRKPTSNIFCDMSPDKFKAVRKMIINCILATDMAKHTQVVAEMDTKLVKSQETPDALLLGRVLLHAADLSNPVRKFSIAKKWAMLLSEEFNAQVDVEKEMGLPVQGWMITRSEKDLAKGEKGFISFNVKPLYTLLITKFPSLGFLSEQLAVNLANYEEILRNSD